MGAPLAVYYNEIDPYPAQWLRNLMAVGLIPVGDVDERSIADVKADDLKGYTQCHFFAGIAGWPLALKLAGWSAARPVWTGSCPCQPFSVAGKRNGTADERHLWPEFNRLISTGRPSTVFGEQVASRAGREWLSAVRSDLEALGYAVGAADLCAAGVGAPHIRQRLFWVADRVGTRLEIKRVEQARHKCEAVERSGTVSLLANTTEPGRCEQQGRNGRKNWRPPPQSGRLRHVGRLGHADGEREAALRGFSEGPGTQCTGGPWAKTEWLDCRDGKSRPVEPGSFPLAHGIPNRVGRLRAYGNAIVPQVAAAFIQAVMAARP